MKALYGMPAWCRLHAANPQALEDLNQQHGVDLQPRSIARPGATMRIRCARLQGQQVLVTDLLWRQGDDDQTVFTVETGHRVLRPNQALERIQAQGLSCDSSQSISLVLLHQLLGQTAMVLDRIDQGLTVSMLALRAFQLNAGTDRKRGAEDLSDVDNHLTALNGPLSFVLQSLDDLEQAALRLRRATMRPSLLAASHVDGLVAEIEGVQRRARFTLERQRFHRRAAGETVAISDLNVTKVFSVLWAAFIPGTALINWYGQNFRVMPELSWDGSLWTQLFAVLVLTAVPIIMVKQSGTLR
ncbi:Magnesium transport protein CorA [Pseudomonas reidholzensis]|uniref:Magnesium transport protein CorA n=1 Tax=Pseudomonas reidholzensis TaxID=1785162 RepID=A0A383RX60_9PSED|nr:CorA family divalent cation transporter [Pseudomonas reidholzensis]SYX91612.1 Magnesium transport protein CorA [Pseudomonas reidholzensis]